MTDEIETKTQPIPEGGGGESDIGAASGVAASANTAPASDSRGASLDALLGGETPALARLQDAAPHARILSNGRYWTAVTGAGSGLSQHGDVALTRWSGDRVEDQDGILVYLRDLDTGEFWSLGAAPVGESGGTFFARTTPGSVTLGRRHRGIEATCEVSVAFDAPAELRRITLRTRGQAARRIEVTVYAEMVVGHRAADEGHPAFAKLFVETALDANSGVVTARRRPRGSDDAPQWAAATLTGGGELQVETDRCRFIGRGRNTAAPAALASMVPLSGTTGSVLDPVFALRRVVELEAGAEASLGFVLAAGATREDVVSVLEAVRSAAATDDGAKAFVQAAGAAEKARRRRYSLGAAQADVAQELAGAMLYAHPALAAPVEDLEQARGVASPLPGLGLSADALLAVAPVGHRDTASVSALRAVASYWAELGLPVALAILCEEPGCTAAACPHAAVSEASKCSVVVACADELGAQAGAALRSQARWLVRGGAPALQVSSDETTATPPRRSRAPKVGEPLTTREKLQFDNGFGAFSADGREYVVRAGPASLLAPGEDALPPMPWCNVVANEKAGFLVSESGAGCTWFGNSRQNKLTPWSNDPVSDPHGEALYLRDHDSGRFWSPQPGPAPSGAWSEVRHGMGWTRWLQRSEAIEQEVTTFLAGDDPVRLTRVRLSNRGSRERTLSLYSFARLVLGVLPSSDARFVVTARDEASGVLLATNPRSDDHASAVAFAAVVAGAAGVVVSSSTDRGAFLGPRGTMAEPAAVATGGPLANAAGGRVDPCFALEVPVVLPPRGEVEVVFALGQAADRDAALALVEKLRGEGAVAAGLEASQELWSTVSSAIEVQTPSKAVDLMLNGWLHYQALSCRINGRTAFYQSGGAFGFRDQLQDSASLVHARPDLARAQIVLHAGHQFPEGDVLHWWHPPADRGTRTRFSDDRLWLPLLTATYVGNTGDEGVLDESAPFVGARTLADGEDEAYLATTPTGQSASVYEHCCLALDRTLSLGANGFGAHGLPLMGTGDWNDGMNRVGREGKGESVWMAFFLKSILDAFLPIVEKRADWEHLRSYRQARERLLEGIETSAWDGRWFRRAYYDDGTVLGSASSDECRIDAIAQAWAVLSDAATPEQARSAMDAATEHLIDENAGIIRLLAPPFDKTPHDPGYIKGYVPGIRENGGQYTHAATWVIRALAKMGDRERAMRLFEMVSPVTRGRDRASAETYKVEPYVVAADVYGVAPHLGRGGWTWYTGSASWMYRTGLESLLGVTVEDGRILRIKPCIPDAWPGFRVKFRLPDKKTVYDITVENPSGCSAAVVAASMGSAEIPVDSAGARIVLRRDGKLHKVKVTLG